jgi:hypothetical protein
MRLRGTLALVAAALALGLYVYLVEIRGEAAKQAEESAARTIFAAKPDTVTRLELDTSGGEHALLVRDANRWRLEAPVAYPADTEAVDRALRALEKLESTETIEPTPADLAPFGLGEGRKSVEVHTTEIQKLFLGGNTPVGGGRYVELEAEPKKLFIVAAGSLTGLTPTLLELRDRRVLRLGEGGANELTVNAGGALVVRAQRVGGDWQLIEPEAAPGDTEKIKRVIDDLSLARASGFIDAPQSLDKYGLASPLFEVSTLGPGFLERVSFGKADGKTYAKRADDPVVLEVNERVVTSVPVTFFDYRAKRVLTLDAEAVRGLELLFPRENRSHRLKREGQVWTAEEPGIELKPVPVEDALYALASLQASGLEESSPDRAKLGLDPALATLRAFDEKGALLGEVSFGDPHPDKGLPALSSQSPLVWRVSNDIGRSVPLSPEAFTNLLVKSASTPPAEPAPEPGTK